MIFRPRTTSTTITSWTLRRVHTVASRKPNATSSWIAHLLNKFGAPSAGLLHHIYPASRELWELPQLSDHATSQIHFTIITAILWKIWKARNSWVFDTILYPTDRAIRNIVGDLHLWMYRLKSSLEADSLRMWLQQFHAT